MTDPGGSFVRVDPDPTLTAGMRNSHPTSVPPGQLRSILSSIIVEAPSGFAGGVEKGTLFEPEDVEFLLPAVSGALAKAEPTEWAVFYLRQRGRLLRPEITTGAFAVHDNVVQMTLGHFRRTDVEGTEEEDVAADVEEALRDDPLSEVWDIGVRLSGNMDIRWRPGPLARTLVFPLGPPPSP